MKKTDRKAVFLIASLLLATMLAGCRPEPIAMNGLTISQTELTLRKGDTALLEAGRKPADADSGTEFVWRSDDEAVATVGSDGTVTAVAPGKAIITVSSPKGFAAGCVVTVRPPKAGSIGLGGPVVIARGGTYELSPVLTPDDASAECLTLTVKDSTIASVDGLTVKGLAVGNTTLTATDGDTTATMDVHVVDYVLGEGLPLSKALAESGITEPGSLVLGGTLTEDDCRTIRSMETLKHLDISHVDNTELWPGAFSYATGLETVMLPSGLTAVPEKCFHMAQDLHTADIPATVKTIGNDAFSYTLLGSAVLPEGLETIGERAFAYTSMKNVTIPSSVTEIGAKAFRGCGDLMSADIRASVTAIPAQLFMGTALREVTFPEGIASIGEEAFSYTSLERLSVPETVTEIGASAFRGTESLRVLHLPAELTMIPDSMCRDCIRLETVNIPDKVISIGNGAFSRCQIKSENDILVLPDSLETVGGYAFRGIKDTTAAIEFGSGLREIGPYAFAEHAKITEIILPASLEKLSDSSFSLSVKKITFTSEIPPELIPSVTDEEVPQLVAPFADPMWKVDVQVPAGQLKAYRDSVWGKGSDAYGSIGTPIRKYYDPDKMHEPENK